MRGLIGANPGTNAPHKASERQGLDPEMGAKDASRIRAAWF